MNRERFLELLDAYGAREAAWPAEERAAMCAQLDDDAQARRALDAARELDAQLDSYRPSLPDLGARVLAALPPPGPLERLLAWLFPGGAGSLLRPAATAALPLVLGVALGMALPGTATDDPGGWEGQERSLFSDGLDEAAWYD